MNARHSRRHLLGVLALGVASTLTGCAAPTTAAVRRAAAPRAPARPGPADVVFHGPPTDRRIALTVDDGTAADVVAGYVEFAQRSGVHLTFSPNGGYGRQWAPHAAVLRPLIAAGQVQIINHTFSHHDLRPGATRRSSSSAAAASPRSRWTRCSGRAAPSDEPPGRATRGAPPVPIIGAMHRSPWRRTGTQVCVALLVGGLAVACATERGKPHPAPGPAPSTGAAAPLPTGPATLADWQLTLPVASRKGDAATVDPAVPTPPYLTTGAGGAVTLWAPVAGTTTPNSSHARTELDNHTTFAAGTERHVLAATLVVTQLPSEKPDVIVGQIHGAKSISSIPFVLLHDENGQIGVVVKTSESGPDATHLPLLDDVATGSVFGYTIADDGDGSMTFTATSGGHTATATARVPPEFVGAAVRFQAGAYQQADSAGGGSGPDDGARVTFQALTAN